MLRLLILTTFMAASLSASVPAAERTVPATLTVITANCLEDLRAQPEIWYLKMNDRNLPHGFLHGRPTLARSPNMVGRKTAPGIYRFTLRLPAGNYEVYAGAGKCFGGQVMAAVLAGHARSTSLYLSSWWSMAFDHDHAGLAGVLHIPNARLDLVAADDNSETRFVDQEDGAFYVDSLQRMKWVLRVWVDCCRHSDFPIDLSGVRPGDYVVVSLNDFDALKRLTYTGTLFSDPAFVAGSSSGAWFTNADRDTVGIVRVDGSHAEYALSPGRSPNLIISDGRDGAWFSEASALVGHVDPHGETREISLTSVSKNTRIARLLLRPDGALLAMTAYPSKLFRILPDLTVQPINVPPTVDISQIGMGDDGSIWFNVKDQTDLAKLDGANFSIVSVAPKKLSADITRANEAFYAVSQQRTSVVLGASQQSTGMPWPDSTVAVSDGRGGVWIIDCFSDGVRHVTSNGMTRRFSDLGCPEKGISDSAGGIWFIADRSRTLWHITSSDVSSSYRLPNQIATPGNLTLDARGVLWFPEHGINRIASLQNGYFREIDLGNPGATPNLTIVP
jgi:streptogramin lyase